LPDICRRPLPKSGFEQAVSGFEQARNPVLNSRRQLVIFSLHGSDLQEILRAE
jgi:hypothetical protein